MTDVERLILSNQYEIMALLDPQQSEGLNRIAENLRRGHEPLYRTVFQQIQPVLAERDTTFVHEILALHGRLSYSYDALPDKGDIEKHSVRWPGFDGNNETEFLSYTRAQCAEGNFRDALGSNPLEVRNSHMTMTPIYLRMLAAWHQLGEPAQMDLAQIKQILDAKRHPG
ncbi:YfbU family protein [Duganella sp. BuS-21]|uniref:YfbU family protein n=1 Tax=Duganella sp. BuS-21 TaxID=2943848 RepID=UPI0035A5E38C